MATLRSILTTCGRCVVVIRLFGDLFSLNTVEQSGARQSNLRDGMGKSEIGSSRFLVCFLFQTNYQFLES